MPVDPSEPDTFEDAEEENNSGSEATLTETSPETPEADAAEQRAELLEEEDDALTDHPLGEVNPADAVEQSRVVETDEDDYR